MPTNNACNFPNPLDVPNGGLGISSATAYGTVCGGTTSASPAQVVTPSAAGTVYTSNGTGALGSYQAAPSAGAFVKLATLTNSGTGNLDFTSQISSTYKIYFLNIVDHSGAGTSVGNYEIIFSTNGGTSWITTSYSSVTSYIDVTRTSWTNFGSSSACDFSSSTGVGALNGDGICQAWLFNLNSTNHPSVIGYGSAFTDTITDLMIGGAQNTTTTAVNAIRVVVFSGSEASATLYGIET